MEEIPQVTVLITGDWEVCHGLDSGSVSRGFGTIKKMGNKTTGNGK